MQLFLAEADISTQDSATLQQAIASIVLSVAGSGGEVIEALVGRDLKRLYVVAEHTSEDAVKRTLATAGLPGATVKSVRIVGTTLDAAKAARGQADYLVEWNLPDGLTMDAYVKRKMEKSAQYARVPEVQFRRTYVCEDMSKCLCLYDAPDVVAVLRARQVVEAGVDGVTAVESVTSAPTAQARGDR